MPSERLETIFRRDLDRLEGLGDHEWIPPVRRSGLRITVGGIAALAAIGVVLMVVALSVQAARDAQLAQEDTAATSNPYFVVGSQGSAASATPSASPAASTSAWLSSAPICPRGQLVGLDTTHPPPPGSLPGSGAASAEAAFRRANPAVTEFKMYPWGESQPASGDDPRLRDAPVWIVAGDQTYIANRIGSPSNVSWFAYPAKVIGCRTPTNLRTGPPSNDQPGPSRSGGPKTVG